MTDPHAALRRLLVDSGALAPAQLDALLAGWTSGPAPAFLLARGAVDGPGARMLEAALKGYARLTPSALRGLFATGDRSGSTPPDSTTIVTLRPTPTIAPEIAAPRLSAHRPPSSPQPTRPPELRAAGPPRAPPLRRSLPGVGELFGRHRILAEIGSSDHALVLRARDDADDADVILKLCRPAAAAELAEWFVANVRSTRRIVHAGVPRILDAGVLEGIPFIVTESMHAQNLQQYLQRTGPLALVGASRIGAQMAQVLAAAARARVIHGDLKPSNVHVVEADAAVKISDFGMRPTDEGPYVAPELRRGASANERSDMYALGAIIHLLALGQPPGPESASLGRAAPLLGAMVARLTAPLPDDRFDDWEDVLGGFTLAMPRSQRVATLNPNSR